MTLWFGLCISCYKLFLTVYESLFIVTTLISISYYSLLMQFTSHLFPFIEWHTFSSFNTLGFLCSKYTLCARLGSRYRYPAKTIGYSQFKILFYYNLIILLSLIVYLLRTSGKGSKDIPWRKLESWKGDMNECHRIGLGYHSWNRLRAFGFKGDEVSWMNVIIVIIPWLIVLPISKWLYLHWWLLMIIDAYWHLMLSLLNKIS